MKRYFIVAYIIHDGNVSVSGNMDCNTTNGHFLNREKTTQKIIKSVEEQIQVKFESEHVSLNNVIELNQLDFEDWTNIKEINNPN